VQQTFLEQVRNDRIALISVLGSFASIVALTIVLLDKGAQSSDVSPEYLAWRIIGFAISLAGSVGFSLFSYYWCKTAYDDKRKSPHRRALSVTFRVIVGLCLVGFFVDGLLSSIYWRLWLSGLGPLFSQMKDHYLTH
jgi:H+/Cl- antiporter ClcA